MSGEKVETTSGGRGREGEGEDGFRIGSTAGRFKERKAGRRTGKGKEAGERREGRWYSALTRPGSYTASGCSEGLVDIHAAPPADTRSTEGERAKRGSEAEVRRSPLSE
jgi:hypothetical protein